MLEINLRIIFIINHVPFLERWDQSCFDPNYNYEPIEFFEPMIREVFKRKAYDPANIKSNQVFGLPLI